jgi:hypothetical protein
MGVDLVRGEAVATRRPGTANTAAAATEIAAPALDRIV